MKLPHSPFSEKETVNVSEYVFWTSDEEDKVDGNNIAINFIYIYSNVGMVKITLLASLRSKTIRLVAAKILICVHTMHVVDSCFVP